MPAFSICKELKDLRSVSKFIQYFNSTEIPENFETFSPKFFDEITLKESEIDINYKLFENPSKTFKRILIVDSNASQFSFNLKIKSNQN